MAAFESSAAQQPEVRPSGIVTFLRAVRPAEGWLVWVAALIAVMTLPSVAATNGLIVGLEPAIGLALGGLLIGWWLGRRRLPGLLAAPAILAAGVAADLIFGVHVLAVSPLFRQLGVRAGWWLRPEAQPGQGWIEALMAPRAAPAPPFTYFADQWDSLAAFGQRVGWWVGGVLSGGGEADNLALVAFAGLIAWCVAAWAGWWIARHGRPFIALAPTGILLAQQVYASDEGHSALLVFLGASTFVLALGHLSKQMRRWEADGADYSPEIRLDAFFIAIILAGLTILLSPTIPFIASGELSRQFWELFEEPYRDVETRFGSSFRGGEAGRSLVPASGVAEGGLPRAHLLGAGPELGKEIALRVKTRGARAGEPLYWRGQTFAYYDGRGWANPEETLSESRFAAGEPWVADAARTNRRTVLSRMEVVSGSRAVLYGAGEPISVDRPYRAVTRSPGELAALRVQGGPRRYNVLGGVIDQDPELLRLAGESYPQDPAFAAAYLQLPPGLSSELIRYAEEITRDAATPYDRATAIESALREIPYSLDVPAPPPDRELVSWFLFDQQSGYCDYYASAMIVLARLSGIPARLAVGYASGTYEPRNDEYIVTELSAHSWPELYFPGLGWVPFEPTAARTAPERIAGEGGMPPWMTMPGAMGIGTGLAELRQAVDVEQRASTRVEVARWTLVALNALGLAWVARSWRRIRLTPPADSLPALYGRLGDYGARLDSPMYPADTPREYSDRLTWATADIAEQAIVSKERIEEAAALVGREAGRLARAYEKSIYAPEATETLVRQYEQSHDWDPLWAALRRLRLARRRGRGKAS